MSTTSRFDLLPLAVQRSLRKFGADIAIARRKRRLTTAMMAERIGITKLTYLRVERGMPGIGLGTYAMALFALGLGTPLANLVDPGGDQAGLLFDVERLPKRVRIGRQFKAR